MSDDIELTVDPSLAGRLRVAMVRATGLVTRRREAAGPELAELLAKVRKAGEGWLAPARKAAVRDMLRHGAYKPAGRAKPSSEYLLAAALDGSFPFVNGPVDANNAASLAYGYPASVFDLARTGRELLLRRGAAEDRYVFNPSGQEIDLGDLVCVWRRDESPEGWSPVGNPVKDAMATKVFEGCESIIAVVYAPVGPEGAELEACAEYFAKLLAEDCGAAEVAWQIVPA